MPFRRLGHVDHQREGFLSGGHQVYGPLEHKHQVLDLSDGGICVLGFGVEVQAWTAVDVIPQDDLLAGFVFGGDVVWGEGLDAVFAAPDQGVA